MPLLKVFFIATVLFVQVTASGARAASDERIERFLSVTGFDVALESIRLSADAAPALIGLDAEAFGTRWQALVDEVFTVPGMHADAANMLAQTLAPELLDHAVGFYASDLGQRLVVAENSAHLEEDDALKQESGEAIVAGLVRLGAPRLAYLKQLIAASGSADASVHAIQEIQLRFILAASAAGVIDLPMEEADLRAVLAAQESALRMRLQASGLTNAAYTYQAFSDEEVLAYAQALEDPRMKEVYALMNAVQFQIMSDRFEELAVRLENMRPSQEL